MNKINVITSFSLYLTLLAGVVGISHAQAGELNVVHKTGIVAGSRCAEVEFGDSYPAPRDECLSIEVAEETHQLKGELGANFGVEYALSGLEDRCYTLSHVLLHPDMITPKGEKRRYYQREQKIGACQGGGDRYADVYSWYIEEPWELVTGDWTFKVLLDGEELVSETITVE